jgi:hypothetical protein
VWQRGQGAATSTAAEIRPGWELCVLGGTTAMYKDEELKALADEWKHQGKSGGPVTLLDLAVALARASSTSDDDESAAGDGAEDPLHEAE